MREGGGSKTRQAGVAEPTQVLDLSQGISVLDVALLPGFIRSLHSTAITAALGAAHDHETYTRLSLEINLDASPTQRATPPWLSDCIPLAPSGPHSTFIVCTAMSTLSTANNRL